MAEPQSRFAKARNIILMIGVALAIFVPIWAMVAALGTKFGLWPWTIGLVKMIGGMGVPLIGVLIVLTFITSLLVVFIKPRAGFASLGFMWVVALGAAGMAFSAISAARAVPPIHRHLNQYRQSFDLFRRCDDGARAEVQSDHCP